PDLQRLPPAPPGAAGAHLEGPFLAPDRRGAHDPNALTIPTPDAVDALLAAGDGILRQITIAPELPHALDAIDAFTAAGVYVAVGHTGADHATASAAFDRGASLLTHAFNAMPGLGHREPGPVGAALDRGHVTLELIADGHHVHPTIIRTLFAAAPTRIALVTDAMSAAGLGNGQYELGGLAVDVDDGKPLLHGTHTLAGSTLTMRHAVDVAIASGVPPTHAATAAASTPWRTLSSASSDVVAGARLSDLICLT
ncbi:N-acetylglucosamine-6-phosphate deacetylase, partial [Glutamicibacter protophormiae]|uniref:N-acetylglucosamine-6-phosphate deacetylase n=1 Tax=Glutamicibacter protophormiae TaxID=37930 RepID=UPI003A8EAF32